ncbi:MAG: hypothetical protein ABFD54_11835 [Armatimonadota bacterium]|nr:hypothetical protein [bacterium]
MNALPVKPQEVANADKRLKYFDALEQLGFEVPYNAFNALPYDEVVGGLKDAFMGFATDAHSRGYLACIQIQSTISAGDKVGIEEAQYDAENNAMKYGDVGFYASFASEAWRAYLKDLTTLFVKQYGYDYVVFDGPTYLVDIPGSQDRFYADFTKKFPEVEYPKAREETTEYLRVQQAKEQTLLDFYTELVSHAKSVGAKKAGIVPSTFIPTTQDTPEGTLNASCNTALVARIPGLDFLVTRMRQEQVVNGTMRTGDDLSKSPSLYFTEVMAHALGKDLVVATSTGVDAGGKLVPLEFYNDSTFAALAAAPCSFNKYWYEPAGVDRDHTKRLIGAAEYANRLGRPTSPVAFVFSYSGTQHAEPFTYETVFAHYWALAKQLAFRAHVPMLTFHAETLQRDLEEHPEVQLLVFEEHFPLTIEQMLVIRNWWQGRERRAAIAFGAGLGLSSDPETPGLQPCAKSFPGIFELIGVRQEEDLQVVSDEPIAFNDVSRVRRSAFLAEDAQPNVYKIADVRRVFGSRANVLYEAEIADNKVPVVAEWRDRSTLAVFCGFGLSSDTAEMAEKAIRYALREVDASSLIVDSCSDGVVWSMNINDYLVMSNLSDKEGSAIGRPGRANFWDCGERRLLPDGEPEFKLVPHSFKIYRLVGRRSKFLDLIGALCLRRLTDGAGRAEMEILAGRKTVLVLRSSPRDIQVDGRPSTISQEIVDGIYYVTLQQCPPGERKITLRW